MWPSTPALSVDTLLALLGSGIAPTLDLIAYLVNLCLGQGSCGNVPLQLPLIPALLKPLVRQLRLLLSQTDLHLACGQELQGLKQILYILQVAGLGTLSSCEETCVVDDKKGCSVLDLLSLPISG